MPNGPPRIYSIEGSRADVLKAKAALKRLAAGAPIKAEFTTPSPAGVRYVVTPKRTSDLSAAIAALTAQHPGVRIAAGKLNDLQMIKFGMDVAWGGKAMKGVGPKAILDFFVSPVFLWVALALSLAAYLVFKRTGLAGTYEFHILGLGFGESVAFVVTGVGIALSVGVYGWRRLHDRFFVRDLCYRLVKYHWTYEKDGTLSGLIIMRLQNRSSAPSAYLPAESLVWYKKPEREQVRFRLIMRDGARAHSFAEEGYQIADSFEPAVRFSKEHQIAWRPKIDPPLEPAETLEYEAEIETQKTETAAFDEGGSTVGFPVRHKTNDIELVTRSPPGYRFELIGRKAYVADIVTGKTLARAMKDLEPPSIEGDGSLITWKVARPIQGARYIISFRFVKK